MEVKSQGQWFLLSLEMLLIKWELKKKLVLILSDILYNDYSFEKNQELKGILNEKESELILLNEENLALKEKILMQREGFESSEKEIFQKNEAEQKEDLKNNDDPK